MVTLLAVIATAATAAQDTLGSDAAPHTVARVRVGALVDGYYAYDVNRPRGLDRAYTTQPARHHEFNVNLAFVEATLAGPRVRGRLALQARCRPAPPCRRTTPPSRRPAR